MDEISVKLTILFENPFWIGLYERIYKNKLEVCKITLGKNPQMVKFMNLCSRIGGNSDLVHLLKE